MRAIEIKMNILMEARHAFEVLSDFSAFEKVCPSVLEVTVESQTEH